MTSAGLRRPCWVGA